MLNAFEV